MHTVQAGRFDLHYELVGEGPPLVLCGGWPPARRGWRHHLPAFTEHRTCLIWDWPGQGGSVPADGAFTTRDVAAAVLALMNHAGWTRADLVGGAIGGCVAQWMAIMAPEQVRSLGLHGSWGRTDIFFRRVLEVWKELRGISLELWYREAQLWIHSPSFYLAQGDGAFDSGVPSDYPLDPEVMFKLADACALHDALDHLHAINCPTLITVGGEDYLTGFRFSQALWERIPGAALHVFARGGHGHKGELKEEFNRMTLDWLARLDHGR